MSITKAQIVHPQSKLVSCTYSHESAASDCELVLIHGWGLNSGVWQSVIPELVEFARITTIDLPGFGLNSTVLPDDYSLVNIVELISQTLPDNSVLVGWSLGGLVAQSIAIEQPERLSGLVTVASTPCFAQKTDWHGIKPEVLNAFEAQLEHDFAKTLARFLAIQALGSPSAKADIKLIQQQVQAFPDPSHVALMDGLALLSSVDLRESIARIMCPTLRLYGRLDSLVPYDVIAQIQQLQPNAHYDVVPHAAHAPFISHRQLWVEKLQQFIQSI